MAGRNSLRRPGELTGARPSARTQTRTTTTTTRARTAADPVVSTFLNETVDAPKLRAEELPDIYEHFIVKVREERRQWTYAQWD